MEVVRRERKNRKILALPDKEDLEMAIVCNLELMNIVAVTLSNMDTVKRYINVFKNKRRNDYEKLKKF